MNTNAEYPFSGFFYMEFTGEQLQRFINICYFRGIKLLDLKMDKNFVSCNVKKEDVSSIKELCKKYHITIQCVSQKGIPKYLAYYGKRLGFLIGAIFCYAFLLYMSGAVWEMSFVGNQHHSDSSLETFLKENAITYGTRMKKINCEEMELLIRTSFDDIAWCSLQQDGCKLTLTITESNLSANKPEVDEQSENGICIVAECDGTIVSIVTQIGSPEVVAGQAVSTGDVLVQGFITYTDDYNEIIGYKAVTASAEIRASFDVYYEQVVNLNKPVGESVLTIYNNIPALNKIFPYLYYKEIEKYYHTEGEKISMNDGLLLLENLLYEQIKIWEENGYEIVEKNLKIEDNRNEIVQFGSIKMIGPFGVESPCTIPKVSEDSDELNRD